MPNCMICKKPVTTGYVVCGACAGEYVTLNYFIDRLAEDIVLDERIPTCGMCVIGDCSSQVSGVTCRNGIKTWLLNKVKEYAGDMPVREEQYFAFLDRLRVSGCDIAQARQRLEQAFPHLKRCVNGTDAILCAWQHRRGAREKTREKSECRRDTCTETDTAVS